MQHKAAFHQGLHCLLKSKQFSGTKMHHIIQGLFLANFIAVVGLYSQCQKVSFFPNFWRKIPNFKSEKKFEENSSFLVGLKLSNIQHCTVSYHTSCNGDYNLTLQLNDVFYDLTIQLKARKNSQFLAFSR